jgi:hypothetical protein
MTGGIPAEIQPADAQLHGYTTLICNAVEVLSKIVLAIENATEIKIK